MTAEDFLFRAELRRRGLAEVTAKELCRRLVWDSGDQEHVVAEILPLASAFLAMREALTKAHGALQQGENISYETYVTVLDEAEHAIAQADALLSKGGERG